MTLKPGMFKLPEGVGAIRLKPEDTCIHPEHCPPMNLHIPSGHGYRHICPACGKNTVITNPVSFTP